MAVAKLHHFLGEQLLGEIRHVDRRGDHIRQRLGRIVFGDHNTVVIPTVTARREHGDRLRTKRRRQDLVGVVGPRTSGDDHLESAIEFTDTKQ